MEIRQYLSVMVEKGASDVYLTVGLPPMYRIEGTIIPIGNEELTREGLAVLCQSIMDERRLSTTHVNVRSLLLAKLESS